MKKIFFLKLISLCGQLITSVSSSCPFGSSLNAGTCVCLPGYTSSGAGASLVCTSLCPVGSNCVVISKRTTIATTGDEVCINLMEVELYLGATKLATSSLAFSMSTALDFNTLASKCNDGDVSLTADYTKCCHTASGDRDAWLLINAGSQSFSRVIVYNRMFGVQTRIDVATLSMFNSGNVTTPAVTFSSFGSGLATYTFCSSGCTGSTCVNSCSANTYYNFLTGTCAACPAGSTSAAGAWSCTCLPGYTSSGSGASLVCTPLCPVGSNCVVISKRTTTATTGDEMCINLMEVELYLGATKLATSSLTFTQSTTYGSSSASKCNDGDATINADPVKSCHTATNDRDAWLLINAGSQSFSKVIVYNRIDVNAPIVQTRINVATLSMFSGRNVTTPAVTFNSLGSGLTNYTFCSTGFTGISCLTSCLANNYYNYLTDACTACPPGSTSAAGSAISCACAAGYAMSGSGNSLVCTVCPEGSSATAGASSCTCIPGFYNSHIANLTNQITTMNTEIIVIKSNITNPQIANLTNQITIINTEISNIKLRLEKLSATLIKLRKRGFKKTEL